jgi:hypothetical protein
MKAHRRIELSHEYPPLAVVNKIDLYGCPERNRRGNVQNIGNDIPQDAFLLPDAVDPYGKQDENNAGQAQIQGKPVMIVGNPITGFGFQQDVFPADVLHLRFAVSLQVVKGNQKMNLIPESFSWFFPFPIHIFPFIRPARRRF